MFDSPADFGCTVNHVKFLILSCLQNACYFILLVGALQPGNHPHHHPPHPPPTETLESMALTQNMIL